MPRIAPGGIAKAESPGPQALPRTGRCSMAWTSSGRRLLGLPSAAVLRPTVLDAPYPFSVRRLTATPRSVVPYAPTAGPHSERNLGTSGPHGRGGQRVRRNAMSALRSASDNARPNRCPITARLAGVLKAGRHIVVSQPARIEPVLERRNRSVVLERASIPDTVERRHLVVPGPAPRHQRQARIGPDRPRAQIQFLEMAFGHLESERWVSLLLV